MLCGTPSLNTLYNTLIHSQQDGFNSRRSKNKGLSIMHLRGAIFLLRKELNADKAHEKKHQMMAILHDEKGIIDTLQES